MAARNSSSSSMPEECRATRRSSSAATPAPALSETVWGTTCCALVTLANPKFPLSRLADAFDQVVEPLITEIT